ncbi:hypothetical protein LIER_11602 [Lithospermum erythrorhizon]|uniref:Uncharacterized protein n=1 Tax=Lithospermum erythrorhizon TaxID=34254 RepID=A0AAV3PNP1_LITER
MSSQLKLFRYVLRPVFDPGLDLSFDLGFGCIPGPVVMVSPPCSPEYTVAAIMTSPSTSPEYITTSMDVFPTTPAHRAPWISLCRFLPAKTVAV